MVHTPTQTHILRAIEKKKKLERQFLWSQAWKFERETKETSVILFLNFSSSPKQTCMGFYPKNNIE